MENAPDRRECKVEAVGKQRNGKPRFWCTAHQASATGKYGRKLERCEGAYRDIETSETITPEAFAGGIAMWGAVKPVYDTTGLPVEEGIHLHARPVAGEKKSIDQTFNSIAIPIRRDLISSPTAYFNRDTAIASYISRFLNRPMMSLFCTYCGEPHLDSDWFAVKPHKRHLCHVCGKIFLANEKCISNPIESFRLALNDRDADRKLIRASKCLRAKQSDFPGGIQIWGSNPALVWTANKPEEEGIHFHGFASDKVERIEDDTFDAVVLDGIPLNEQHLKYFMAQQSLSYLENKIVSLTCNNCGKAHFDEGESAFIPKVKHACSECGQELTNPGKRKKVVSNPFLDTISKLNQANATN